MSKIKTSAQLIQNLIKNTSHIDISKKEKNSKLDTPRKPKIISTNTYSITKNDMQIYSNRHSIKNQTKMKQS